MAGLFPLFGGLALGVLAFFGLVQSGVRGALRGWLALALSAGMLAGLYLAGTEVLGRAKPARLALLDRAERAQLAGSVAVEGEAIYLWLVLPDETAPRAYALPWSEATAEALRAELVEADESGTGVEVRDPFAATAADGPEFSALPPPDLPPKAR